MSEIDNFQRVNLEAPYMLAQLVNDADGPLAASFDAIAYNFVLEYALTHCGSLRQRARRDTKKNLPVYDVPDDLLAEVAHETAWRTCVNIRENAAAFDPSQGTATTWVIGRAALMYLDISRKLHGQRERLGKLISPEGVAEFLDATETPDETGQRMFDREAYADAVRCLTKRETQVFLTVVQFDLPVRVIAEQLGSTEKAVQRVYERAKKKVAASLAQSPSLTSVQPSVSNLPSENADEESA
jgi:RNA polymerase sigma factor (sigma-70 family)